MKKHIQQPTNWTKKDYTEELEARNLEATKEIPSNLKEKEKKRKREF